MIEVGVAQAQANFTKFLDEAVAIVDKKTKKKKAVILPYEQYEMLLNKAGEKKSNFAEFIGLLDKDFKTDDARYNEIVK